MVSTEEILYISSRDHQLQFHMLGEELSPYRMYRKLDELEEELHEMNFLRIHKSYLVNLQYIKKIERCFLLLCDGTKLSIPKVRYTKVKQKIREYKTHR